MACLCIFSSTLKLESVLDERTSVAEFNVCLGASVSFVLPKVQFMCKVRVTPVSRAFWSELLVHTEFELVLD